MPSIVCILLPYFYDTAPRKSAAHQPGVPSGHWERAKRPLLRTCLNYTTCVEPVVPGLVFLDLSRLPGSKELIPLLAQDLQGLGEPVGSPLAIGWSRYRRIAALAAHQAAQQLHANRVHANGVHSVHANRVRWQVVSEGQEEAFVSSLPLHWADDFPASLMERLRQLGLHTWGQLAALPLPDLIAQVGAEPAEQLAQWAHGRDATPVRALYPPAYVQIRWPADLESSPVEPPLLTQLPTIVNERLQPAFLAALQEGPWQAQRLVLACRTAFVQQVEYAPAQGVRPEAQRLRWQLQALVQKLLAAANPSRRAPFLSISEICLRAEGLSPAPARQEALLASAARPEGLLNGELLDLLAIWQQRFGAHILLGAQQPLSRREQVHALWRQLHQM